MLILVDIDGVVADTHREWLAMYNWDYNDDLTAGDIKTWEVHQYVKPECGTRIYDYLRWDRFYENVEPVRGAVTGVRKLRSMGHRIVFVSAGIFPGKAAWLGREGLLTELPYGQKNWEAAGDVVLANDKSLIRGDILIDDRYENVDKFNGMSILFNQPWNASSPWSTRADGWSEVVQLIENIGDINVWGG